MKKWIALALVCMVMLSGACMAAEWPQGRSPAQPYSGTVEVDLSQTMGYIIFYPRTKKPATMFCDLLEIYLPREDVEIGSGYGHLMEIVEGESDPVEVCTIDFSDPNCVGVSPMEEELLQSLMWGSGVSVEMRLAKSLEFGDGIQHSYYVTLDEGCFTAANGTVKSPKIVNPEAWIPVLEGEYGMSGLYYAEGTGEPEAEETEDDEEAEEVEAPAEVVYTLAPKTGDTVTFDLVIGGEIAAAVVYSENESVSFEEQEYRQNAHVTGRVIKDDVTWGVVFLDETGEVVSYVDIA